MNNRKCIKGITLIELIITLGLLGVITALVFSFFFTNKNTLNKVEIKSDLQYEAKEVMNKISKYAMEASKVEIGEDKVTFLGADVNDKVVFKVTECSKTEEGNKVTFTGQALTMSIGEATEKEICTRLKFITFSGDEEKNIEVKLMLEEKNVTYSISDNFVFRNSHLN